MNPEKISPIQFAEALSLGSTISSLQGWTAYINKIDFGPLSIALEVSIPARSSFTHVISSKNLFFRLGGDKEKILIVYREHGDINIVIPKNDAEIRKGQPGQKPE